MKKQSGDFENERQIDKIGGRLESDYDSFKNSLMIVNAYYIPFFFMLGYNKPSDKDFIIETLMMDTFFVIAIKERYIEDYTKRVANGEIPLESLLSQNVLNKEKPTPEKRQKYIDGQIHRVLMQKFNDIKKRYTEKYGYSFSGYLKEPLLICRDSLSITPNGFVIDVDEFIRIYKSFLEADESELKRLHQSAADAINKFFNGSVEITQKELARYFVIESGVVRPNPKSINIESYMKLGKR